MKLGLSLATSIVIGCGPGVARTRAAYDLQCPIEQISVYHGVDDSTVASGCGKWTQYQCFATRTGYPHCVRERAAEVHELPEEPAPESAVIPDPGSTPAADRLAHSPPHSSEPFY
jgi:hypothetical protein